LRYEIIEIIYFFSLVEKIKLRMFFPQELDALLYYNEFMIDHKYGTFNEGPFSSDSNL